VVAVHTRTLNEIRVQLPPYALPSRFLQLNLCFRSRNYFIMLCEKCEGIGEHFDKIFVKLVSPDGDIHDSGPTTKDFSGGEGTSEDAEFPLNGLFEDDQDKKLYRHHQSYSELAESARKGCELCTAVVERNTSAALLCHRGSEDNDKSLEDCQIYINRGYEGRYISFMQGRGLCLFPNLLGLSTEISSALYVRLMIYVDPGKALN
jgi:hypothetical protein